MIECSHLTLAYDGMIVLKDLSFSVKQGDYLCILGENGSGKSTLMKALLGLKAPVSGRIDYTGVLKKEIGYIPQRTEVQMDFPASCYEIVCSGMLNRLGWRPFFSRRQKAEALENMKKLGIADLKKRSYRELSGGQQQRVLLARALCSAGKLIMLDEPVAGLDPQAAQSLYELIRQLNEEGMTVIMVTHDVPAAVKYSNQILQIRHDGYFFGSTEEYCRKAGKGGPQFD